MTAPMETTEQPSFNPYDKYRKGLLSQARVRKLSRLRPWRPIVDSLWFWAGIVFAWTLVARWPHWWTIALAVPVIATRYYALLIVGHDGIHRRLFRSPRWNDWFADLVVFAPVGAITRINNQNHLGHHRHLSTDADPDLHQFTCTNKYRLTLLLIYLSGVASFRKAFTNIFFRRAKTRHSERTVSPYTVRDVVVIGIWQMSLIGGLTLFVAWWAYPMLWLVPLYLTFIADNVRAFAEHSWPEPDSQANHHRLITYVSNPLEQLLVAPCNMNYHAAHHLWPSIPYYNLPAADQEIRNNPGAANLEWRRSYFGYLLYYFAQLPIDDCDSDALAALQTAGVKS